MPAPFILPSLTSAINLLAEPDPPKKWVVPGLFAENDRLIVTGNEGDGKSTFIRQMANQIAAGIHPFTLQNFEAPRVLLLDLENSRQQVKEEIRLVCDHAGIEVPEFQIASLPAGLNLASADYEAAFMDLIGNYEPQIIMGGPLYKMSELSLSDENASRQVVAALDRIRERFHCAMVLEAHQINEAVAFDNKSHNFIKNRQPRPFGSSIWRRWPEFGLCLFTDGTLFHWRGDRQARDWPKRMWRDGETWLWEVDTGLCPICGELRPESRERYCSDKCSHVSRQRDYRDRVKQPKLV